MGAGARIGLVTGLFASWLTLSVNGIYLWLTRFVWHQGGQMDSDWLVFVDRLIQSEQQMFVQMGSASTAMTESLQMIRILMLSPEGRAGFALSNFVLGTSFLLFFATLGGAMGARLLVQSRRPSV